MTRFSVRFTPQRALFIGSALNLILLVSAVSGQSNVVFVTADPPNFDSNLYRFDAGVQTFGVGTAASDAFIGMTLHNGSLLVGDFVSNKIQKFAPNGAYLGVFATSTNAPVFVEADSSGNVYTTPDSVGPLVGTRLNSLGVATQTYSGIAGYLVGIDADASGNVYIAQVNGITRDLLKFAPNGAFINSTSLGSMSPWDLSIDEAGNRLFLADQSSAGAGIRIFNIAGVAPALTGSIATPATARIVGVHYASESGNILATDYASVSNDPRGLEYSPGGALLAEYRPSNAFQAWDITTYVPEPTSFGLISLGLLMLGLKRNRVF
jgi:hypothetical protein